MLVGWAIGASSDPSLFSPPPAFPLPRIVAFAAELAGSACCRCPAVLVLAGDGLFGGLLRALLLADVSRGGGRAGLLLIHHRTLPPW
jgi:hypothetical protein